MSVADEQQFCLRWNNFQANITSQFEALRDDEDFTDVTIACEGQRIQAHKVVLSACSPFFKELFKTNPCTHPIIFMRDVEVQHVVALMEFMYAGEVNVAQAHLSAFLKTAESLKIRGLTDTSSPSDPCKEQEEDSVFLPSSKQYSPFFTKQTRPVKPQISSTSNVTSSQDIPASPDKSCTPPPKKQCRNERNETELPRLKQLSTINEDSISVNPFTLQCDDGNLMEVSKSPLLPKMELPDYLSDDDRDEAVANFYHTADVTELTGGMEIIPQTSNLLMKENNIESNAGPLRLRRRRNSDNWMPFDFNEKMKMTGPTSDINSRLRECQDNVDSGRRNRLVKLGEGIEIYEDQLRSVKWSDYRKLTRGLATILFSPAELATCSVTGQRWSRAGSGERPVKPALDRAKVQAIISYVATRFPMVEISRIKQVLAYKCKENSTALKMKAVRYYGDQTREPDRN